eukprot:m.494476 g.494476  ORF g.494476 m.494476 type:complete len:193 (-) comp21796_c1_seq1:1123-1701(-)
MNPHSKLSFNSQIDPYGSVALSPSTPVKAVIFFITETWMPLICPVCVPCLSRVCPVCVCRVQYYDGCYQCIQYRCCRCAMGHTHYDLSGLGLEVVHKAPTFCGCCIGEFRDNKDMRFLKDIDGFSIYGPCPFCCYKKKGIILHFHDDDDDMRPAEDRTNSLSERVTIYHPYMTDENVLKMTAVWAELRLVDG